MNSLNNLRQNPTPQTYARFGIQLLSISLLVASSYKLYSSNPQAHMAVPALVAAFSLGSVYLAFALHIIGGLSYVAVGFLFWLACLAVMYSIWMSSESLRMKLTMLVWLLLLASTAMSAARWLQASSIQ